MLMVTQSINEETTEILNEAAHLIPSWAAKLIFVFVIIILAAVLSHLAARAVKKVWSLDAVNMPSASIFINLIRFGVWGLSFCIVLKPVFGIEPTTVLTALGIGGLAISFGMKDTIANIVAGIQLTLGQIIAPGDHIKINGIIGTVHDVSWRHTTVISRAGEIVSIPNSVLNTSALTKLNSALEGFCSIPFIMRSDQDADLVARELRELSYRLASEELLPEKISPSEVKFTGLDQYGVRAELWIYVRPGKSLSGTKDKITRAMKELPYFVHA